MIGEETIVSLFERKRHRWRLTIAALSIALTLAIFFMTLVGSMGPIGPSGGERIPLQAALDILFGESENWPENFRAIIMDIRLPRILLGVLVGCSLAVSGAVMQGVFKNPMADPYIIGLSAGAAVGASASTFLPLKQDIGMYALPLMAFIGATSTVFLVYQIAKSRGRTRVETLLLSGIAVGSFLAAVTSFLLYLSGQQFRFLFFWLLGGLWMASWKVVWIVFPVISIGTVLLQLFARDLNAMLLGEEQATHLGIDVKKVEKILLALTSLVAGTAVAFSGIIGFVGLIIPHMMRIRVGPNHTLLLPASTLAGGLFLASVDTVARTIIAPTEIPVGVLTALCGAPFFAYLLRKSRRVWL